MSATYHNNNKIIYENGQISAEYKKIDDWRLEYSYDENFWTNWDVTKEWLFSRISTDKEVLIFKAEKLNWKNVIVRNFIEWPEFVMTKESSFSSNNNNVIYSIIDELWTENIYLNNKLIYKRTGNKLKLRGEIKSSDNWKYIIWDRDSEWKLILYYEWKNITTDYLDIDEIFLSQDWTTYWWKVSEEEWEKYSKLIKNWKEILDLWKYIREDEYWNYDDDFLVYLISDNNEIISYSSVSSEKKSIFVDDKAVELGEDIYIPSHAPYLRFIEFWDGIFWWIVINSETDISSFYILDTKTLDIRYSQSYNYFWSIKYQDGYVTFYWKLDDWSYRFVHDLVEYNSSFNNESSLRSLEKNRVNINKKINWNELVWKIDLLISKMNDDKMKKVLKIIDWLEIKNVKTGKYNAAYYQQKDILSYIYNALVLRLFYN